MFDQSASVHQVLTAIRHTQLYLGLMTSSCYWHHLPSLPPLLSPPSLQLVLSLSFMEAVRGCTKEVAMRVQATCDRCMGSGGEPGTREQVCPYCQGRGEVRPRNHYPIPLFTAELRACLQVYRYRYFS